MLSTPISRSLPMTLLWLVLATASLGFLAWIFAIDASLGNKLMGSVLLGGLGLAFLLLAIFGASRAPCPRCGATVTPDPTHEDLCRNCGELSIQRGKQVVLLAGNHIAEQPRFGLPLRPDIVFPTLCAHCGEQATRTVEVNYQLSFAWRALITASAAADGAIGYAHEKVTARVPVCDQHDDGGEIRDLHKQDVLLCVRSWGFARTYREANREKVVLL